MISRFGFAALVCLGSASCSKKEPEKDTRRDPWLAQQPDAQQTAVGFRSKFVIESRCDVNVELPAREATPRGAFRVCKGELDLNLSDLDESRGTLSIDVGSIEMRGDGDAGRSDDYTQQAQNWLDIGGSRPEAERERLRWATFTITSANDASAEAAHAGKLVRDEAPATPKSEAVEAEADAKPNNPEERAVTLQVKGDFLLHGVRVEVSAPIRLVFRYPERAASDRVPDRVRIESRRAVSVLLKLHDIKPRSSAGTHLAEETKLFGSKVGTEAKVSFSIAATPKRTP